MSDTLNNNSDEIALQLIDIATSKINTNVLVISEGRDRQFNDDEMDYIIGYIVAACDILTVAGTHAQADGHLIHAVILGSLQKLFGPVRGMDYYKTATNRLETYDKPKQFDNGLNDGEKDMRNWLNGQHSFGIGKAFIEHFGMPLGLK